jgi:hypothetical protein
MLNFMPQKYSHVEKKPWKDMAKEEAQGVIISAVLPFEQSEILPVYDITSVAA